MRGSIAWSQPDSTKESTPTHEHGEVVIFIGSLNFDCYPDTVYGFKTDAGYLPKRVLWGLPKPDRFGRLDTNCIGRTPLGKRVHQTVFTYPSAHHLDGSVAFQCVNSDTLTDVVLHLRGKLKEEKGDRDSLRSLVLFGQHSINAVPVIYVGDIRRFQTEPFVAMDLVVGSELTHPAMRDLSGQLSYVLEPISLRLDEPEAPRLLAASSAAGLEQHAISAQVSPNPSSTVLRVEATGITDGTYRLELVSVTGAVERRATITLAPGEPLRHMLDVTTVPSGSYVVRIGSEQGTLASTAPIIITH